MKKTILILSLAAFFFAANNANAQIGINFGYSPLTETSTYSYNGKSSTSSVDYTSFFVGATYNVELPAGLGLSLGVQGRYATCSDSVDFVIAKVKTTVTQMYLDVPVLLNYGITLGRDARLSAFVGPMFTYALSGTSKSEGNSIIGDGESTSDLYGENSSRSRINLSAAAGLAFTYTNFRLFGGYQMGLMNLTSADNTTMKTSGVFFGLGYAL